MTKFRISGDRFFITLMSNVNRNKAENLLDELRHGDTAAGRLSCFGSAELANQQKISHAVRRQFS